jgi:hypothetical protein
MATLVPAATELRLFGIAWCALGAAALAGLAVLLATAGATATEVGALCVVLFVSLFGALGGLLLAKRTGPAILYRRIFDRAPQLTRAVELEPPRHTARRVVWPALGGFAGFAAAAPLFATLALVVLGSGRDEVLDRLAVPSVGLAGGWTLACGVVALRIAYYFRRWERAKGKRVLCLPRRAGLMLHVYVVVDG